MSWVFQKGELKRYVDMWNATVWEAMPEGVMKDYSKMTEYGYIYGALWLRHHVWNSWTPSQEIMAKYKKYKDALEKARD